MKLDIEIILKNDINNTNEVLEEIKNKLKDMDDDISVITDDSDGDIVTYIYTANVNSTYIPCEIDRYLCNNDNIDEWSAYTYCADCGAKINIENDDYIENSDGDIICESCRDENYYFCDCCENWEHIDNMTQVYTSASKSDWFYVCDNCLSNCYYCSDCGDYFKSEDMGFYTHDGSWVCENCGEDYNYCENCGEYYPSCDTHYNDDDGCYYCDDCYDECCNDDDNGDNKIYSYHQFNNWIEYRADEETADTTPTLIGFELETIPKYHDTDNQSEALDLLYNNLNVVAAHDSSLDYGGFEIISHPQSFKYIMDHKDTYKMVLDKMTDLNYVSHDCNCCGLHFHVTRPNDPDTIDKIWLIMETYKQQIIQLSRRKMDQLEHWAKFLSDTTYTDNDKIKALYFIKKTNKNSTRYMALNNTNDKTIEFRFFRGTLNYNTFMADLEFINNLITLCSNTKIKIKDITWERLTEGEFIKNYVIEHNIITDIIPVDNSIELIKKENKQKRLKNKINNILFTISKRALKNNITLCKNTISDLHITTSNLLEYYNCLQSILNDISYIRGDGVNIGSYIAIAETITNKEIITNIITDTEKKNITEYINNLREVA